MFSLEGHTASIQRCMFFNQNQHLLLTASLDGTLKVWNVQNGSLELSCPHSSSEYVLSCDVSQDDKRLFQPQWTDMPRSGILLLEVFVTPLGLTLMLWDLHHSHKTTNLSVLAVMTEQCACGTWLMEGNLQSVVNMMVGLPAAGSQVTATCWSRQQQH